MRALTDVNKRTTPKNNYLSFSCYCVTLAVCLCATVSAARAAPIYEANLPDFYQHQKAGATAWFELGYVAPAIPANTAVPGYANGNWWESDGGWCGTTAWTDIMYHWDQKVAVADLFDHSKPAVHDAVHNGKTWLERFNYLNEDMATWNNQPPGNAGCIGPAGIRDYVGTHGWGNATLDEYDFGPRIGGGGNIVRRKPNGGALENTTYTSLFEAYAALLPSDATVVLEILPRPVDADPQPWWGAPNVARSFHFIAGAGVEAATNSVYFADPNNTNLQVGAPGMITPPGGTPTITPLGWGFPYPADAAIPIGAAHYQVGTMTDGITFDNGPYNGAYIQHLYTLAPEPATVLMLVGALALLRRRRTVTVKAE
jgi:hypothetical protein